MLNQNMMSEATRLTRAGQLVAATALLQRMLRGESDPVPSGSTAPTAPASLEPPTIDVKATVVANKQSLRTTRLSLTKPAKPPPMAGRKQEVRQLQD
jgi:hypothetical protein